MASSDAEVRVAITFATARNVGSGGQQSVNVRAALGPRQPGLVGAGTAFDHPPDGLRVPDVFQQIRIEQNDVGQLASHDARVRQIAHRLEGEGYDVQADVAGFPQLDTIGGCRPDVIANKPGERKVIEVETPDSVGSARDEG